MHGIKFGQMRDKGGICLAVIDMADGQPQIAPGILTVSEHPAKGSPQNQPAYPAHTVNGNTHNPSPANMAKVNN